MYIQEVPLCEASTVRVMKTLFREGEYASFGEEELLYGAFSGFVSAVRSVAFETWAVKRRHATLFVSKRMFQHQA